MKKQMLYFILFIQIAICINLKAQNFDKKNIRITKQPKTLHFYDQNYNLLFETNGLSANFIDEHWHVKKDKYKYEIFDTLGNVVENLEHSTYFNLHNQGLVLTHEANTNCANYVSLKSLRKQVLIDFAIQKIYSFNEVKKYFTEPIKNNEILVVPYNWDNGNVFKKEKICNKHKNDVNLKNKPALIYKISELKLNKFYYGQKKRDKKFKSKIYIGSLKSKRITENPVKYGSNFTTDRYNYYQKNFEEYTMVKNYSYKINEKFNFIIKDKKTLIKNIDDEIIAEIPEELKRDNSIQVLKNNAVLVKKYIVYDIFFKNKKINKSSFVDLKFAPNHHFVGTTVGDIIVTDKTSEKEILRVKDAKAIEFTKLKKDILVKTNDNQKCLINRNFDTLITKIKYSSINDNYLFYTANRKMYDLDGNRKFPNLRANSLTFFSPHGDNLPRMPKNVVLEFVSLNLSSSYFIFNGFVDKDFNLYNINGSPYSSEKFDFLSNFPEDKLRQITPKSTKEENRIEPYTEALVDYFNDVFLIKVISKGYDNRYRLAKYNNIKNTYETIDTFSSFYLPSFTEDGILNFKANENDLYWQYKTYLGKVILPNIIGEIERSTPFSKGFAALKLTSGKLLAIDKFGNVAKNIKAHSIYQLANNDVRCKKKKNYYKKEYNLCECRDSYAIDQQFKFLEFKMLDSMLCQKRFYKELGLFYEKENGEFVLTPYHYLNNKLTKNTFFDCFNKKQMSVFTYGDEYQIDLDVYRKMYKIGAHKIDKSQ